MKRGTGAAALAMAALVALAAQAQTTVYRWVDKDGKTHFSDTPPPPDARDATQKRMGSGPDVSNLPYATQVAMQKNPVTLFSGADCGDPCTSGRSLLESRGIPFTERDAQGNPDDQEALKKLIGALEVPLLVIGSRQIKGYEEAQWQSALDGAGYPRTRLPGQAAARRAAPPAPTPAAAAGEPPAGEDKPAAAPRPQ